MPTKMDKAPVCVVVIAKNEEKRLEDCLKSVAWAGEIVVVDDFSTDRTVEIAKRYTKNVYQKAMDIEGRHRNWAYEKATQPWVLSLDADERVTPELAESIRTACAQANHQPVCYSIPIRTYIGSQWIRGAGYYPAAKTRLFQKGKFRYEEARVHPRVIYEGSCGLLKGDILHYSCANLEQWIAKFNRETTLEAEKWVKDGRKVSMANSLRKTCDRFLKNYFLKKGWKDGFLGFLMSVFHGLYQLFSYAKYREMTSGGLNQPPRNQETNTLLDKYGKDFTPSPLSSPPGRGRGKGEGEISLEFNERRTNYSKIVFIDRDGVINVDPIGDYVKSWEEFRFEEGALEGLKEISDLGLEIILISNQAGVGDGVYPESVLWNIHEKMMHELKTRGIKIRSAYYCLHGKNSGCACRKPETGLFKEAVKGLSFDPSHTFFIGDKFTDVQAGKRFGLRSIFVRTGHGRFDEPKLQADVKPDFIVDSLADAVEILKKDL